MREVLGLRRRLPPQAMLSFGSLGPSGVALLDRLPASRVQQAEAHAGSRTDVVVCLRRPAHRAPASSRDRPILWRRLSQADSSRILDDRAR